MKVAKYYYHPGWWEGSAELTFMVNEKKWAELPKAYQAALEAACYEANVTMTAKYDARNPEALRRLVASGAQLRAFPRPVMEAALKAANEIYEELSGKSPHWKRIYEGWRRFRAEEFLWFRVAENQYDNFVFANVREPSAAPAEKKK